MASSQIIILAIIATSVATFISRFMGALTSEKVSVKSRVFQWFNFIVLSGVVVPLIIKAQILTSFLGGCMLGLWFILKINNYGDVYRGCVL